MYLQQLSLYITNASIFVEETHGLDLVSNNIYFRCIWGAVCDRRPKTEDQAGCTCDRFGPNVRSFNIYSSISSVLLIHWLVNNFT